MKIKSLNSVYVFNALATGSKSQDAVRVATKQLALLRTKLESIDTAAQDIDDAEEDVTCTLEGY